MKLALVFAFAAVVVSAPAAASPAPIFTGTVPDPTADLGVFLDFYDGPFFDRSHKYSILVKVSRPAITLSAKLQRMIAFGEYFDGDFGGDDYRISLVDAEGAGSSIARASFVLPKSVDTVHLDEDGVLQGGYEYNSIYPDFLDWSFATSDPLDYSVYIFETGVPEAATWAMLIAGFGLTGAALRRRRHAVA